MTRIRMQCFAACLMIGTAAMLTGMNWGNTPAQAQDAKAASADPRQADRAAIQAMMKKFTAAFEAGDAAAAVALMTAEAEIIQDDAHILKGRDEIRAAYTAHFADGPKPKIKLETESIRFTSRDTALEDGAMTITRPGESPETVQYHILYVREDGKWLISIIKEWPDEETELSDLDWLIGSWSAKREDAEIATTYEWMGSKAFIRATIHIREKERTLTAMQIIGIDPATGVIRTWTFEHDGGFGEGFCERDGHNWVFQNVATLSDGSILEATNILVPVDRDTITWQPIDLTIDGIQFGNLPPMKVTRVGK